MRMGVLWVNNIFENIDKELKILRYAAENRLSVVSQYVDGSEVLFSVARRDLKAMETFCCDSFGSCRVVEEQADVLVCRVD